MIMPGPKMFMGSQLAWQQPLTGAVAKGFYLYLRTVKSLSTNTDVQWNCVCLVHFKVMVIPVHPIYPKHQYHRFLMTLWRTVILSFCQIDIQH